MTCARCQETPGFHSFELIAELSNIHYFYCFPAHNKQSVRTREDMLNFVSHFPQDRQWSLIFHANGYGFQHLMPLSLALDMGKLVQETHKTTLQKIYIVEGHWFFQFVLQCILPFLNSTMRDKFVLVNGSLLEVIAEFRKTGLTLQHLEPLRTRFG
jgi:hypothetical protein